MVLKAQHIVHIFFRGVPRVSKQVLIVYLLVGYSEHLLKVLIFGILAFELGLLRLGVGLWLDLFDELSGDG